MDTSKHLAMDELLALRDGEGGASSRSHVEACDECRDELERLYQFQARLRAMPTFSPPRDVWPRVVHTVRRRRLRRRLNYGVLGLAAAAALTAVVVLRGPAVDEGDQPSDSWTAEASSLDMGPVILRSRQLESLLQTYRPAQRVYDAPTALAVSVLEDRIVLLDQMLSEGRVVGSDRAVMLGLWGERVATLETLVGLQAVQEDRVWR
jgi:hypothetical protein